MSDHYSILGLTKNATNAEIKTAYRRLVKVYHPDKNPNNPGAVEKFRLIQEAYDTLSDSSKRTKYDHKVNYSSYAYSYGGSTTQEQNQTKTRTKKYTFTDEDLKRRQYYKEHYKQNPKQKTNTAEQKKAYNEVKYILFSVPIAIALLFFIINIYNREKTEDKKTLPALIQKQESPAEAVPVEEKTAVTTGAEPYNYLFGSPKIDRRTLQVVQVTNWSGMDAVVCVVDAKTNKPVRNYFVGNNYNILYEYLPEGTYYLRNYVGKTFNKTKKHPEQTTVSGVFEGESQFQTFPKDTFVISLSRHDTLARDIAFIKNPKSKNIIDAKTFFSL
ncbi:MAG: DnaJ-class molecular chaperone with C-terminal Zn finger domain [Bacteroidetes bacterium]|jgi:curved DNA-binding protein CbpA|nr:DnaJ-class molecular chaperone with C-terminal Zn finger domain [Bacteroidota bacterium]